MNIFAFAKKQFFLNNCNICLIQLQIRAKFSQFSKNESILQMTYSQISSIEKLNNSKKILYLDMSRGICLVLSIVELWIFVKPVWNFSL